MVSQVVITPFTLMSDSHVLRLDIVQLDLICLDVAVAERGTIFVHVITCQ